MPFAATLIYLRASMPSNISRHQNKCTKRRLGWWTYLSQSIIFLVDITGDHGGVPCWSRLDRDIQVPNLYQHVMLKCMLIWPVLEIHVLSSSPSFWALCFSITKFPSSLRQCMQGTFSQRQDLIPSVGQWQLISLQKVQSNERHKEIGIVPATATGCFKSCGDFPITTGATPLCVFTYSCATIPPKKVLPNCKANTPKSSPIEWEKGTLDVRIECITLQKGDLHRKQCPLKRKKAGIQSLSVLQCNMFSHLEVDIFKQTYIDRKVIQPTSSVRQMLCINRRYSYTQI